MPIPIRRYNIKSIAEAIKKKSNSSGDVNINKLPKNKTTDIDYSAKISRKV